MKNFTLISLILLIASCTSQQIIKPENFASYRTARVNVTTDLPGAEEEANALSTKIVEALKKRNIFHNVVIEPIASQEKTLRIDAIIVYVYDTSDAQRISLGQIAGSDEVIANISLHDDATGEELSVFRIRGVSPDRSGIPIDWPWGSVDKALEKIAEKLALQLSKWSQTSP